MMNFYSLDDSDALCTKSGLQTHPGVCINYAKLFMEHQLKICSLLGSVFGWWGLGS